jgi:hypothetical protein
MKMPGAPLAISLTCVALRVHRFLASSQGCDRKYLPVALPVCRTKVRTILERAQGVQCRNNLARALSLRNSLVFRHNSASGHVFTVGDHLFSQEI